MEKKQAAQIIKSRKLIMTPGYTELRATSIIPVDGKFIINFNGMTSYHQDEALKLMKEGNYQDAVNQNLTASLRPTDFIPEKGEICRVYIEDITTNNGIRGLFVTSVAKTHSNKVNKVNGFDEFLTDENEVVESVEASTLETKSESVTEKLAEHIKA
jgi:hypothetical protein